MSSSWSASSTGLRKRGLAIVLLALLAVAGFGVALSPYASASTGRTSVAWPAAGSPIVNSQVRKASPLTPPIFGPNVKANQDPTTNGQHEPSMAVSRTHPDTIVVAQKDYRNGNQKEVWIESSTDGGVTWPVDRQLQMPGINASLYPLMSDPVVMARDDGRIYVSCLGYNNQSGVFITWTDDDGATWHTSVTISGNQGSLQDKDWFAVDNTPTSPYYHNVYVMWAPGASYVAESHSSDGGLTWTSPHAIGASNTEYTYPVIGHDGTVYNFMMLNWGGGQTGTIQLTKSTDGGATWSTPSNVTSAVQPPAFIPGTNVRFFAILSAAIDPNNGALYVAWTDYRNQVTAGMEVVYVKSTDGGATWGSITRLSHNQVCAGCDHITPMVTVGADSKLHAFWLDRSLNPSSTFFDSWYSSSTDGGATWDPDTRVSTVSQDLNLGLPPGSGGAAGDYWGLDTVGNLVYVAWNDTRNGNQDIYVGRGVMGGGGTVTPSPTVAATNTPVPTSTQTVAATSTQTATSTATQTAVASSTATTGSTSTSTVVPTSSVTATAPLPTSTTGCIPGPPSVSGSASCSLPGTYDYSFDIGTPQFGIFYVQFFFEASASNSGPWDVLDQTNQQPIANHMTGTFSEPSIPASYQFFRVRARLMWADCAGTHYSDTSTNAAPLCRLTATGTATTTATTTAGTPQPTPTTCTIRFTDVPPGSTFYDYIRCLACRGIMSGYPDGTFRPNAEITRGELSKIVSNSAGYAEQPTTNTFEDVAVGSTFFLYVERLYIHNAVQGYACGGTGEPCVPPANKPYFRPNTNVTRGQAAKIIDTTSPAMAPTPPQFFEDVPSGSPFYQWIEDLSARGAIGGYACGQIPEEPCVPPDNRPYFRPNASITRGQASKIVSSIFFPGCSTPAGPDARFVP